MAKADFLIPADNWFVLQDVGGVVTTLPIAAFAYVAATSDTQLSPWVWNRATRAFIDARLLPGLVDVYRAGPEGEPFANATEADLRAALPFTFQPSEADLVGAVNTKLMTKLAASIADKRIHDVLVRKLPSE
jgi:hypothetical protein